MSDGAIQFSGRELDNRMYRVERQVCTSANKQSWAEVLYAEHEGKWRWMFETKFATSHITNAQNFPLESLRQQLNKLPQNRKKWLACWLGQRA